MVDSVSARALTPAPSTAAPGQDDGPNARRFLASLIDIINPLQHIPVISTIYRAITGDEISAPAKLVGGALFGGVIGAAAAAVSVVVEDATGRDVGEHALALLNDDRLPAGDASQLAAAPAPNDILRSDIVWNGPRMVPAGPPAIPGPELAGTQQAPAAVPGNTPAPTLADLLAAAPIQAPGQPSPPAPIAPRNGPLLAQSTTPRESAADLAARITWSGAPSPTTQAPAAQAPAEHAPAAQVAAAQPPADWVSQAIAQARAISTPASAAPRPSQATSPEPWIAGAMLQALEKYEALAIARANPGDSQPPPR